MLKASKILIHRFGPIKVYLLLLTTLGFRDLVTGVAMRQPRSFSMDTQVMDPGARGTELLSHVLFELLQVFVLLGKLLLEFRQLLFLPHPNGIILTGPLALCERISDSQRSAFGPF